MSYTYAILELSREAYEEIERKLRAAGYDHAFHNDDGRIVIDMHGIAVAKEPTRCALAGCTQTADDGHRHGALMVSKEHR